jgi:hypothetical protein
LPPTGSKKKLYAFRPDSNTILVETQRTTRLRRREHCDPLSLERDVRQLLANKVSGTLVGIWLLIPELLRLGAWDLLCGWSQSLPTTVFPRLALQLVNESALCVTGIRQQRSLSQKGFELANGLPFIASDFAIHDLLEAHTVAEAEALQIALGRIRRASGHYQGHLLAIDPHHMRSYSKRQMRRHRHKKTERAVKTSPTFFCLDVDTGQPIAFTTGSSARTVSQVTPGLANLASAILNPAKGETVLIADKEHCTAELFNFVVQHTPFDLLVQQPAMAPIQRQCRKIPSDAFVSPWAGLALSTRPYRFEHGQGDFPLYQFVQRCGEKPSDYYYRSFLSTSDADPVPMLIDNYPKRWHLEEFFLANQALGWNRAGTLNLNIRYGHMTMALVAQAAIHQLRQRLNLPHAQWDAAHLARSFFSALDGDVRVTDDTVVVTYYNAPQTELLRSHYEGLPEKLSREGISPQVPWLYNYRLDFRFR